MKTRTVRLCLVAALGVAATSVCALAQDRNDNRDRDKDRDSTRVDQANRRPLAFVSSKWLLDRKIRNSTGEEIATVSDYIMDRGSGHIEYVVAKTGSVLGLGGKKVTIAHSQLRWDTQGEQLLLNATADELKQCPEFSADEWKAMSGGDAGTPRALRQRLMADAAGTTRDPFAAALADGKKTRFQGEVIRVERNRLNDFGEYVFVTVRGTDNVDHKMVVGPSWFVNSSARTPMRSDQVVVTAIELPRDPEKTELATTLLINGEDVPLRAENGTPLWALRTEDSNKTADKYNLGTRRYLLVSELNGAAIDCRGAACGKVDDSIFERDAALLTFLSIDPNENFLGIGDTKRLVPWTVCTMTADRRVRIDASKEMILASPETPKDLMTLNSGGLVELTYKAYDVPMPRFEPMRARGDAGGRVNDAWARDGVVLRTIKRDSPRKFTGKYLKIQEVRFDDDGDQVSAASGVSLNADGETTVILLGPSWYMENQKLPCKDGDPIIIEASRATINGKEYWLARSIDCGGTRIVLVDNSGAPAWERAPGRDRK